MLTKEICDELNNMEKNKISSILIDKHILTYKFNSPIVSVNDFTIYKTINNETIYDIPRYGDLLLDITIKGSFSKVELYQNGSFGRVVYDTLIEQKTMNPFPSSGFPLLCVGNSLWLSVYDGNNIMVTINYALLETSSRKTLANYKSTSDTGVIVKNNQGIEFIVNGLEYYGYSPNYLAIKN
jgi:hypothetical protein